MEMKVILTNGNLISSFAVKDCWFVVAGGELFSGASYDGMLLKVEELGIEIFNLMNEASLLLIRYVSYPRGRFYTIVTQQKYFGF